MRLKSKAFPSNISLASGHVLMILLCGGASAAEGETAFSKDPDRAETICLQQSREVRQAGDKELKVQPHTHPICLEYLGYLSPGHWSNTSKTCSHWLLCLKHPIQTIKITLEGLFCSQPPPLKSYCSSLGSCLNTVVRLWGFLNCNRETAPIPTAKLNFFSIFLSLSLLLLHLQSSSV